MADPICPDRVRMLHEHLRNHPVNRGPRRDRLGCIKELEEVMHFWKEDNKAKHPAYHEGDTMTSESQSVCYACGRGKACRASTNDMEAAYIKWDRARFEKRDTRPWGIEIWKAACEWTEAIKLDEAQSYFKSITKNKREVMNILTSCEQERIKLRNVLQEIADWGGDLEGSDAAVMIDLAKKTLLEVSDE